MRKFIALIMVLLTTSLFSIEVDIDEISKSEKVDFVNYTGQATKSESVSEIKSIGHRLSYLMKSGKSGVLYRYNMKYSILRALDKNKEKFSADILFIDKDAKVDHIKNVRRIISSYLEGMYAYTTKEADAIAVYVTYYNAVYRGDLDYFSSKYSPTVMKYLTKNNAGIATVYKEWPGKTAIAIPLTEENMRGEIENIDAFAISESNIRKEVARDKENQEASETLDDVKQKDVDKSKKSIEQQKQVIEDRKEKIAEKQTAIEKKKEEIKKDKEEAAKITDPQQKKAKEDEIKKKEAEVKKEEKRIAEEQKRVDTAEEKVKKAEDAVEKKEENISDNKKEDTQNNAQNEQQQKQQQEQQQNTQQDKQSAKTENQTKKESELNKREDALKDQNKGDGIYGLKIYYLEVKDYLEGGHYNNTLYMINTQTNKIDFKSPFTHICGRKYDVFSNGIVVIAHNGDHKAGHKLALIDRDKLTEIVSGEENIFFRSFIEIKNNNIYAII
ncbi:MAG: hypothetical protein FWG49_04045, partial [Leptospirales bacterium]|nr:hypothetical protein [Leptospirales bacterium]